MMRPQHLLKKQRFFLVFYLLFFSVFAARGQEKGVNFSSDDKQLELAFQWAKGMAMHYRGDPADAVGPWYESALPPRSAFCMRDVSHQCIGGEILGLDLENKNMLTLFAKNISASKNWCSYWEINRSGKPAPEDYRSDNEFWYNLPANFDLLNASWRLYLWTGDRQYIDGTAFRRFREKSVTSYISSWLLDPGMLLKRPAHPNALLPYNEKDSFDRCRGLPSYSEGVPNMKMGADLVAALYRGLTAYGSICKLEGQFSRASLYARKSERYRQLLDNTWWDKSDSRYFTYYSNDGRFGKEEGETFLLWFDAVKDTLKINRTLAHIASRNWNVENTSYLPVIFYQNGQWEQARRYILYLANPSTPRREYPEVSFGVIEGVVQGLMGVDPDARFRTISTLYKMNSGGKSSLGDVAVLGTTINVSHIDPGHSIMANTGTRAFKWKAMFYGVHKKLLVNGLPVPAAQEADRQGHQISFVITSVHPGDIKNIRVKN